MNKFIEISKTMKAKKDPLMIVNTDRSDKVGTDWWSILDRDSKSDFLLMDSFGVVGLKNFIIKGDKKVIQKVLKGIEKLDKREKELNLINLKFSPIGLNRLTDIEKLSLSETAIDLFSFY